jgi:hypothetical protein
MIHLSLGVGKEKGEVVEVSLLSFEVRRISDEAEA